MVKLNLKIIHKTIIIYNTHKLHLFRTYLALLSNIYIKNGKIIKSSTACIISEWYSSFYEFIGEYAGNTARGGGIGLFNDAGSRQITSKFFMKERL